MSAHRHRPDSIRTLAGVAEQDPTCQHGTEGCPGPGAGPLSCVDCFAGGEK
jgi:hypothetical protein